MGRPPAQVRAVNPKEALGFVSMRLPRYHFYSPRMKGRFMKETSRGGLCDCPAWTLLAFVVKWFSDLKFEWMLLRLPLRGRCWPDRIRCLQLGSGAASGEVRCFAFGHGGIEARITWWYLFLRLKTPARGSACVGTLGRDVRAL